MTSKAIEHDRRKWLGGSDVAAVLGLSPWKTPLQLYEEKVAKAPPAPLDPERERFFARRKRQEPVIAEMLADEYGIEVTRLSLDADPNRYADERLPFMAAEIDFECRLTEKVFARWPEELRGIPLGSPINGEIKTVNYFRAAEWQDNEGNPDLPIHYAAQALHGMGVTRRPVTIVAALFGLDKLLAFPVLADADTIAAMREKCRVFWQHVESRVPPAPSNIDEIKALYKNFRGTRIELDDEAYSILQQRFAAAEEEDRAKGRKESLEFQLADRIYRAWGTPAECNAYDGPEYERAILCYKGHQVGSWNRQGHAHLDQKSLKAAFPELVKTYTVAGSHRVLRRKAVPK